MGIIDKKGWEKCVKNNSDAYGGCCVNVARRAMEILDAESGDFDCHELVSRASKEVKSGGITGFMAGAVASIINGCHSRGEEFRKKWNKDYGVSEDKKGIVNPAILTIDTAKL